MFKGAAVTVAAVATLIACGSSSKPSSPPYDAQAGCCIDPGQYQTAPLQLIFGPEAGTCPLAGQSLQFATDSNATGTAIVGGSAMTCKVYAFDGCAGDIECGGDAASPALSIFTNAGCIAGAIEVKTPSCAYSTNYH